MKSLTKLWCEYYPLNCDKTDAIFTKRLFFQKLEDVEQKDKPLYLTINTLTGAIDIFNTEEGKMVEEAIAVDSTHQLTEPLFQNMLSRGYIFTSHEIENLIFDTIVKQYKAKKYLKDEILGFFSLDNSCPMKCEYCFEKKHADSGKGFENAIMDEESLKIAFNFLNTIKTIQQRKIEFVAGWGGEPLQTKNYELNKLFVKLANKYNFPVAYFSNLAYVDKKIIDLLENDVHNLSFIQTTIDDLGEKHNKFRQLPNAFEITVDNIDKLLKKGLSVGIRTNIGVHNIQSLPQIAQFYYDKGWFEYPKFRAYLTHISDRHREFEKKIVLPENEAVSIFLKLRDKYPLVRRFQGFKFGPSIKNILEAFSLRESFHINKNCFEIKLEPTITPCSTLSRAEYVFTGKPNYSLYTCAESVGISKFRFGNYCSKTPVDSKQLKFLGIQNGSIHEMRSVDTIKKCSMCKAAMFCGGHCLMEEINENGNAYDTYCRNSYESISNFLKSETGRLYKRAKVLIEKSEHITL
ncbi:MAG: SPASM domain-containing protein [Endomicrobium sp.]|jgi:uncharacterized protein|nr:SPASM domain-containing protein [Endomicrobium sp.]